MGRRCVKFHEKWEMDKELFRIVAQRLRHSQHVGDLNQDLLLLLQRSLVPPSDTPPLKFLQNQKTNTPCPCTLHLWIKSERKQCSPTTSSPVSLTAFWFGFKVTASIWRAYYRLPFFLQIRMTSTETCKIIQTEFLSQDTLPGSLQPQSQQVPLETMVLTSLWDSENASCPAALAQDVGNMSLFWFTSGSFTRICFALEWKG